MKRFFQYAAAVLLGVTALTACQPETFDGADQTGVPTVAGKDFTMVVDQETNQVQVSFPETPGVYPVWIFNGAGYSTLNSAGYQNNKKGTYTVGLKLGNRNGFSQGTLTKQFTFNETKASFATELNRLGGNRQWRIDYAEPAHLACGPYGGDGSGWWSAAPEEKKAFGVYDDRITFESDGATGGTFTYDPGEDGLTYININSTLFDNGGATADFDTPTQPQTSTFLLKKGDWTDALGNVVETNFLELGPNTLFPYISHDRQYQAPRFRIETLTASKLVLVYENEPDNISWRFIFTSKEPTAVVDPNDPSQVKWVAVDSPENLGRDFNTKGEMEFWWADAGWSQIGNPQFAYDKGVYTITANDATSAEWQAQNSIQHVAMNIEAGQAYDISVKLEANQALGRFTFKICDQNDDDNTLIYQGQLQLDAGENLVQFANVKAQKGGADSGFSEAKLFIDLGGCPAGLQVKLSDIIVQKHVGGTGGGGFTWADVNSADNIGNGFNSVGQMEFWWADAGWSQIGNPGFAFENGVYIITATDNGGSEWQAQNSIHHVAMNIEPGQLYAVRATIEASSPVGRYTFKICDEGDDDNTLVYNGGLALEAGENMVEFKGVKAQKGGADSGFSEAKLFIDLGGISPGTEIRLSDIIVQKYEESAPAEGGSDGPLSYDDAGNMWKDVDNGTLFDTFGTWFANDSWAELGNQPVITHQGDTYELTLPEGMGGSQWQGQFHIDTKLTASGSKKYDFQVTMETTADCPGVTFKLTDAGDSNYFFEERQNVPGNDEYVFTRKGLTLKEGADATAIRMFFDFGGSPVGTQVTISKIVLREAK